MRLTRRGEVLAGVMLVAGLLLASGCDDPTMGSVGELPLCTPVAHNAPCIANGDNEPTVEVPDGADAACFIGDPSDVAPECWEGMYYAATASNNDRVERLPDSWPCMDGTCLDPGSWKPLPSDWVDAMYEGEEVTPATAWEDCWLSIGDTSYVVCPDGTIETS